MGRREEGGEGRKEEEKERVREMSEKIREGGVEGIPSPGDSQRAGETWGMWPSASIEGSRSKWTWAARATCLLSASTQTGAGGGGAAGL